MPSGFFLLSFSPNRKRNKRIIFDKTNKEKWWETIFKGFKHSIHWDWIGFRGKIIKIIIIERKWWSTSISLRQSQNLKGKQPRKIYLVQCFESQPPVQTILRYFSLIFKRKKLNEWWWWWWICCRYSWGPEQRWMACGMWKLNKFIHFSFIYHAAINELFHFENAL